MASAPSTELTAQLVENAASLRRLARALVGEGEADDLVQETFEATWQRPPAEGRPVRPWLRAVLVNRARMSARSRGRREERELAAGTAPSPETPEASVARLELQRRVADAVLAIAEPYRQTLIWRFVDDLSSEEIARRLDAPSATVRSRLKRGLEMVRAELDRGEPDPTTTRGWRAALLPFAAGPTAVPHAPALFTGGLMSKLTLAAVLVFAAAALLVPRVTTSSSASRERTTLLPAPTSAETAPAPRPAAAPPPSTSLRRFATAGERARLAEALARSRRAATTETKTFDFSGTPVPPALPTAAPTLPPGELDKDYIRDRIREILPLAGECYEIALDRRPDLAGTMAIDFVIDAEEGIGGYVREAVVAGEGPPLDPELAECMTETILSVQFQPPEGGGTVRVVYPFSFQPSEPATNGGPP